MRRREPRRFAAHHADRLQALHGLPLASFGRRALAWWLDYLFLGLLLGIGFVVYSAAVQGLDDVLQKRHLVLSLEVDGEAHGPGALAFKILVPIAFFGLQFWLGNGRTLAKRLLGIRVVSLVHHRMTFWHSAERALGYAVSLLEFGFGYLQYFIHPNRQTTHDRIAETIVVDERRARRERGADWLAHRPAEVAAEAAGTEEAEAAESVAG